jgi:hypothetical protein
MTERATFASNVPVKKNEKKTIHTEWKGYPQYCREKENAMHERLIIRIEKELEKVNLKSENDIV